MDGEKISLKKLLLGMEGVFDAQLGTSITITYDIKTSANGFIAYYRKLLPAWIQEINETSGGSVKDYRINREKKHIVLEMFFPGAVVKNKMHPLTANAFLGQFRKLIADEVMKNFPLPFDAENSIFLAGVPDLIIMNARLCVTSNVANRADIFFDALNNGSIKEKLASYLEEHGAHLLNFFEIPGAFMGYAIIFKWQNDTPCDKRSRMVNTHRITEVFGSEIPLLFDFR